MTTNLSGRALAEAAASFSPCRTYRYSLWRRWADGGKVCAFIGLNPSTADETQDDPTIRRCVGFAKTWGCNALCMLNLFAFRAADPEDMKRAADPVGPENDAYLKRLVVHEGPTVAAWGAHGGHRGRSTDVLDMLEYPLFCFGKTKDGKPRHPLYIKADAPLLPFNSYARALVAAAGEGER